MAISAGQMEAKLTLDASQYMQGMSAAQEALSVFDREGASASAFFAKYEAAADRAGAHISQFWRQMKEVKHTILGPVEVEDPSAQIGAIAGRVRAASDDLGSAFGDEQLEAAHEAFRDALNFDDVDGSGVERVAAAIAAFGEAAMAGNLNADQLAQYGGTVQNLLAILNSMDAAGGEANVAFLGQVADALTALGYPTDAERAVETLRGLADAYRELEAAQPDQLDLTPEMPVAVDVPLTLGAESVDAGPLTSAMAAAGAEAAQSYVTPIEDGASSANAAASGMASAAGSGAETAAGLFSAAGDNAGAAFASGILGQIGSAVSAAASMAAQAAAAARARLSIHSPSKVFREMGANTARGFALGISDELSAATQAVNRLANESMRAAAPVTNNNSRTMTININGASIAPGTDVRKFSRQLAQYIQGANYGVT